MNFSFLSRVFRFAAIGAILLGSASCITINEELGGNLIPIDQKWDVYPQKPVVLEDIRLQMSDSLSGYSTTRFTFGAVNDAGVLGTSSKTAYYCPIFPKYAIRSHIPSQISICYKISSTTFWIY